MKGDMLLIIITTSNTHISLLSRTTNSAKNQSLKRTEQIEPNNSVDKYAVSTKTT